MERDVESVKESERRIYNQGYSDSDIMPDPKLMERLVSASYVWLNQRLDALPPGTRVLDIGCGSGSSSMELARRGFDVVGLDLSSVRIEQARETAKSEGLAIEFAVGDAENPDFEDESFDLISCRAILHHLPNVEADLASYARLLRPGGSILVYEPGLLNPFAYVRRTFFPTAVHTPDEHPFVPRSFISMFERNFDAVDHRLYYVTSLAAPIVEKVAGPTLGHAVLSVLAPIDRLLVHIPGVRQLSWIIVVHATK